MATIKVNLFVKRIIDILGSSLGLVLLSPLLVFVIIFIKVTMPGPILFKQERVGRNMKIFHILKFRTMRVDIDAEKGFDFTQDKDRLTCTGKLLRRIKIDELPQLINVFLGDMSLVGPRPTIKMQVDNYNDYQMQRLSMRPGMTGLAQVNGNSMLPWEQRIQYDIEYLHKFSVIVDLKILLKTVGIILLGEEKFFKKTNEWRAVKNLTIFK